MAAPAASAPAAPPVEAQLPPAAVAKPVPAATAAPISPSASAPVRQAPPAKGRPMLAGSISIAAAQAKPVEAPRLQAEVKPLTQEDLERYWQEAGAELGLENLLGDATVRLGEHTGRFEIDAQTTYFHEDFKPHRIEVLEALRRKSGMRMLDCKVNQLFVSKDEIVYSPEEKYKAMLQDNPAMKDMRRIFPEIDY